MTDTLLTEIAARRDDLIELTQDLIRIPTLNPPGREYRAPRAHRGTAPTIRAGT